MGITVTGFGRVDTAAAEIAGLARDSFVYRQGRSTLTIEARAYAEATRLRDEIIAGLAPHFHSATGEEEIMCWCVDPTTYARQADPRNPWEEWHDRH
jgi:hypothetical protein